MSISNCSISENFSMTPDGKFECGSYTTIVFTVKIGKNGIKRGGQIKIGLPDMGWSQPLCTTTRSFEELLVGQEREHNPWKPRNTNWKLKTDSKATIHLSSEEKALVGVDYNDKEINRIATLYGQWRWWITATVENEELNEGDELIVIYGDTEDEPYGARVPQWHEDKRDTLPFVAIVDKKGDRRYREMQGSPVYIELVAGKPENVKAVMPSLAKKGDSLSLKVNVLDRGLCPAAEEFKGKIKVESDNKLIPEKSIITVKDKINIRAINNGAGRVNLLADNLEEVESNPTLVDDENDGLQIFWGDLHSQSRYHQWRPDLKQGDSSRTPAEVHEYARDCSMLDFAAITDGFGAYKISPGWEETQQVANDYYEPGKYVPLKGWECGMGTQGDKCVIYRSAEIEPHIPEMVPSENAPTTAHALINFYKNHKERVLTIPHSFMKYLDWSVMDPELDRLMEVYSTWGSYESRSDNPLNSKRCPKNQSGQYAWSKGLLLGITAAGDLHIGYPGRSISYGDRYHCQCWKAGICGVYSKELTREGIWDALYNRQCYGTTGVRIVLDFKLNTHCMGSVIYANEDELCKRNIKIKVAGTDYIRRVDIMKNNAVLKRIKPKSDFCITNFDDILPEPPKTRDIYYVRVFQADGNAAWSSPIWIGPEGVEQITHTDIQ